jgi:WD40 repeat protein
MWDGFALGQRVTGSKRVNNTRVHFVLCAFVVAAALLQGGRPDQAKGAIEQQPQLIVTTGHTSRINSVAYSSDGRLVASAGDDGVASVWDVATGVEVRRFAGHGGSINYVAFAADGDQLFAGGSDDAAYLWSISSGKESGRFPAYYSVSHGGQAGAFALSPDGRHALTVAPSKEGILWDIASRREVRRFPSKSYIVGAAFSLDGGLLALSSENGWLEMWDVRTGARKWGLQNENIGATSIAFSRDGQKVIVGDIVPHIRNARDGREILRLKGHEVLMLGVAISASGALALTANWDRTARLWNAITGQQLLRIPHPEPVSAVTFSPNGEYFVTASWDGSLRMWRIDDGLEVPRFETNVNVIAGLGFSMNRPYVLGDSRDNVVFLWDSDSGARMKRFAGHRDRITSAVLSPDGQILLTGGGEAGHSLHRPLQMIEVSG